MLIFVLLKSEVRSPGQIDLKKKIASIEDSQ